ncbi:MAG: SPOR domain-containing protein [Tatlockia sp.]|nr:SPOR domain-containing protein [Tatlockia sp.]
MIKKAGILTTGILSISLAACTSYEANNQNVYTSYSAEPIHYQPIKYASVQPYETRSGYSGSITTVPDSHYTGSYRSPTSHKDIDRSWVDNQNPNSYTIQIGESDKAYQVAGRLHKTPKTERSAEVKYDRNGQSYYKGVYGSFNSQEDAQKALNSLPPEIKQGAEIKSWSSVQERS